MKNEFGESPLNGAAGYGHVATCRLLIERGATMDYQNKVRLLYAHHHWHWYPLPVCMVHYLESIACMVIGGFALTLMCI